MKKSFVIKSTIRANQGDLVANKNCYFIAWHSYTPFYGTIDKAERFNSFLEAHHYAMRELFTNDSAFEIEEID